MAKHGKVVLGVTGSIAAYKAADILRRLIERGWHVSVVMTREAENFITPLTLSALAGEKVYRDMFEHADDAWTMPHIALAREADVLLIAPATAAIIGKLACGIADNLLTCLALATPSPILMAPAMHVEMYKNKIVQDNCRKLRQQGVEFIGPVQGKLACGMMGEGHLADTEMIVRATEMACRSQRL